MSSYSMEAVSALLRSRLGNDRQIAEALGWFEKRSGQYQIHGLTGESKALLLALGLQQRKKTLVITHSEDEQKFLVKEISRLLPGKKVLPLPVDEGELIVSRAHSRDNGSARMRVLEQLLSGQEGLIIASAQSAAQRLPARQKMRQLAVGLECGKEYDFTEICRIFASGGYERCEEIEGRGQFALRGGIIDIFPATFEQPVRIEFFGDEIDSIRLFTTTDQRSVEKLDKVAIFPFRLSERSETIAEYLDNDTLVVVDEASRIKDLLRKLLAESSSRCTEFVSWEELANSFARNAMLRVSSLAGHSAGIQSDRVAGIQSRPLPPYRRRFDVFAADAAEFIKRGYSVLVFLADKDRVAELAKMAENEGVSVAQFFSFEPSCEQLQKPRLYILKGELNSGVEFGGAKTVLVSEEDLFTGRKHTMPDRVAVKKNKVFLDELRTGDYVVHNMHGIGRYIGVETLAVDGLHRDYFHIQYSGTDKLFIPVDQAGMLQRYVGGEEALPRLSKLGGGEWEKRKARAKKAVEDIAQELIALHAERAAGGGITFLPDCEMQNSFEDAFPYPETPDQLQATIEIKRDMESAQPMERLLCGDVGFGKTEVALRAAFKAVMSGYQVAVLAPTTVLALQHYNNIHMRCNPFGVKTGLNCRLVRDENKRLTMNSAKEGKLDILVGTHGLLREDTYFRKLGLIIIDEEQRFGVKQKEFMKKWRGNADILALSATPIPRTLHMALGGARDMSVIETPPPDRLPVQTYVIEATDEIVRQAIRKELNRGGQVFFVYNRVATMEKVYFRLKEIVPEARVVMAHGQMPEEAMELAITEFYEGRYDVLLATTIVENGIDMPNVNTVIIYDADRLGLSQLHQLRGRVGRSNRQAYAYFLYRENKVVNETAERRLRAVQDYTELGVGFKIAMRDLEIRGAGDILGAQQHGHIAGVGFLLYARMLEEAVTRLRGGRAPVVLPEPQISLQADGYIPDSYITDAMHKIKLYQRIAAISGEEDIEDILDEMIDRFGEPPQPVLTLLDVALLKSRARCLGVAEIAMNNGQLQMIMTDKPDIHPEKIMALQRDKRYRTGLKLSHPGKITVNFIKPPRNDIDAALEIVKKLTE